MPRNLIFADLEDGTLPTTPGLSFRHLDSGQHSWSNEIRLMDVEIGKSSVVINDEKASEPNWLGAEDL